MINRKKKGSFAMQYYLLFVYNNDLCHLLSKYSVIHLWHFYMIIITK